MGDTKRELTVGKPCAIASQSVQVRSADFTTKAPDVTVSEILYSSIQLVATRNTRHETRDTSRVFQFGEARFPGSKKNQKQKAATDRGSPGKVEKFTYHQLV